MRHTSGNSWESSKESSCRKIIASILLLAALVAGKSLALRGDVAPPQGATPSTEQPSEPVQEVTRDTTREEMDSLVKSAQESFGKGRYKEAESLDRQAM